MQDIIKRLGKPRSFLVSGMAVIICIVVVAPCVLLGYLGNERAALVGFFVGVGCWAVFMTSLLSYIVGQSAGRYRNLGGKSWSELPW